MVAAVPTQFAPAERAEEDALNQQIQIFEKEHMASIMLDAVPDLFMVLNQNRQIVYVNAAFKTMLGQQDVRTIYGQRLGEVLGCIHATETEGGCGTTEFCRHCGAARAILSGLQGLADVQECHISAISRDVLDFRVSAKPLHMADQNFVMFAVQDIGHEKRRRIMERVFFHDILNAAGMIRSLLSIAEASEEDGDPFDLNEYREMLDIASERIVDEIHAQQFIMNAEANELQVTRSRINVQDHLAKIIKTMQRNQDVAIRLEDGAPVSLYTDPTLLGRVLINLIKNAMEASMLVPDSVVTVAYAVHEDTITFKVHNTTYMPRAIQLQIFKRSFSTKGEGRGLGTYSIKLLTEQYLGGTVDFESSKADGTTFFVTYPLGT